MIDIEEAELSTNTVNTTEKMGNPSFESCLLGQKNMFGTLSNNHQHIPRHQLLLRKIKDNQKNKKYHW